MTPQQGSGNGGKDITGKSVRVVVESLPPKPAPTKEEQSEKKVNNALKWGKVILEVGAFLGLLAYVCETRRTNDLTQQALDDGRKHFAETQRPWVGLSGPLVILGPTHEGSPPVTVGLFNATMKNFGASPALNVISDIKFVPAKPSTEIRPKIEEICKQLEQTINPLNVGVALFPTDTSSFKTEYPLNQYPKATQYSESTIFFFPGCIIYRERDGTIRHTKICQWTDSDHLKPGSTTSPCARESAE